MIGALNVNLVGGESGLLHIVLAIVGPLLIAGAAIGAALVARKTANERQQAQLAHDTERQERQLQHDRALRDRDFLRQTVTSALEHALEAMDAVTSVAVESEALENLHLAVMEAEKKVAAVEGDDEAVLQTLNEQSKALEAANQAMDRWSAVAEPAHLKTTQMLADNVRLRALVGAKNRVRSSHWKLAEVVRSWNDRSTSDKYLRSDEQKKAAARVHAEIGPTLEAFEQACRERFEEEI
jgi:hypothetical protein